MAKTIKQIAEEIGVTKQAVFKKIKSEPLSTELEKFIATVDGKIMISTGGEKLIKQAFNRKQKTVTGNTSDKNDENLGQVGVNQLSAGGASENALAAALQLAVDALTSQLEEKDRQIAEKDRQLERQSKTIEELATSLAVAQHTAQAAQALHAGTIRRQINESPVIRAEEAEMEAEPEEEPGQEQKKKRGIFSRLFGG